MVVNYKNNQAEVNLTFTDNILSKVLIHVKMHNYHKVFTQFSAACGRAKKKQKM